MYSKKSRAHFQIQQKAEKFYTRGLPDHSYLPEVEEELLNSLFLHFREFHKKGHYDSNYIFNGYLQQNPMGSYKIRDGHIVGLTLGKNFTASIPREIGDLSALEELRFSHLGTPNSNIRWRKSASEPMPTSPPIMFPPELDKITTLQRLWIEGCRLTEIPSFVGKQVKLERLLLRNEFITRLPDFLSPLTNLKDIHFDNMPITHLPSFIGDWSKLTRIYITRLPLVALPDSIGKLTQIESLSVRFSKLRSLPDSLGKLVRLKILSLNNSELHSLPDSFKHLQNLRTLGIASGLFSTIPDVVKQLRNLTRLEMPSNFIIALPEWIEDCSQLKDLSLNNNQIISLSSRLTFLKSLSSLQIKDNPLRTLSNLPVHFFHQYYNDLKHPLDTGNLHPAIEEILGKRSVSHANKDKILEYYAIPPRELALRYAHDVLSLTPQENTRLLWEGGPIERSILEAAHLPPSDPIIRTITNRLSIKTGKFRILR
jgi:Leucine-rich repeat (LRR) protein